MTRPIDRMRAALSEWEAALDSELEESRAKLRYRIERGRITFDREVLARHRALRVKLREFLAAARPMVIVTAPVIYSLILPFALLDLFVSVYQAICFPVYGITKVRRADHVAIDRQHLAYLNGLQKLNCIYCGYSNGVYAYAVEIAARTEQYWCPIKHASKVSGAHGRYPRFADFGDAERYRDELQKLREALWEEAGRSK